jgi:DNA-binding transcriptional ArsR family regulator
MMRPMQREFDLINGAEQAAAALHPIRVRLLEQFREPISAAEAARRLDMPRQRIGHHVRRLQAQGLLASVGERRQGAFTERLLQTTARAWAISPRALGVVGMAPDDIRDKFSSDYLAAASARTLRDLGVLRDLADEHDKRLATLTVETEVRFATPADQAAFAAALTAKLAELVAQFHNESATAGRRFRFMLGGHPEAPDDPNPDSDNGDNDGPSDHPH